MAVQRGFNHTLLLAEGIVGWEQQGYAVTASAEYEKNIPLPKLSPRELQKLLDRWPRTFTLLDIRERAEFADGHIAGAVNVPLSNFTNAPALLGNRTKKIIIYCSTGARNYSAYRKLRRLGYTDMSQAILKEWLAAGLPLAEQ
jgi:phage shock protein E